MTTGPWGHPLLLAIALTALLALAWTGVTGGMNQVSQSTTPGEWAQTTAQIVYGFVAIAVIWMLRIGGRRPATSGATDKNTMPGGSQ